MNNERQIKMNRILRFFVMSLGALLILFSSLAMAQDKLYYHEPPMELQQMGEYEDIRFEEEIFEKIAPGMSQEDVLELLGKPADMKKIKRRKNRWTFHYYYPDGYVVNFRNGLVVGKEKIK